MKLAIFFPHLPHFISSFSADSNSFSCRILILPAIVPEARMNREVVEIL